MKKYKFFTFFFILSFLLPVYSFAQQEPDITGVWKGTLYEDTPKQTIVYEIAISDNNGKLNGYSYAVFKGDNGDEIGIKTLKIKRKKDKIIIEDADLIDNSYSIAPPKKIRKYIQLTLTIQDSIMIMDGIWATNRTNEYRPVTGTIVLKRKNDNWKEDPLLKKLDDMKLTNDLSFTQPAKKEELAPVAKLPQNPSTTPIVVDSSKTIAIAKPTKKIKKPEKVSGVVSTTDSLKTAAVVHPAKIKKSAPVIIPPAVDAAKRKTETIQTISYQSDSLKFIIYDNGIVDGDTVSILMNGSLLFSKAGLSEKPISKTVYTKDLPDSLQLVWYAENLGSIPPNTGLLIIMDGKIRHEVFFSADLQTNAAVILQRKKKV